MKGCEDAVHVYTKEEAEAILRSFSQAKLDGLLALAKEAKRDSGVIVNHGRIELPEGWAYEMYANSIIVRYLDGEQERQAFFVPSIYIEFENADTIQAERSVLERRALGFCSCGKSMPFVRLLLKASDMIERKGIRNLPIRGAGYSLGFLLNVWIWLRPIHQYSLAFNRHPDCL